MGSMCSWLAFEGASKGDVLHRLGFRETGEKTEPGSVEPRFSVAEEPTGWVILFAEDYNYVTPERVSNVSVLFPGLVLGCQFEDKIEMRSVMWAARDGREVWSVFHDTNGGSIYRLDITGDPPVELGAIRDMQFRAQDEDGGEDADVDHVHDVVHDLGYALCGFRFLDDHEPFSAVAPLQGEQPAASKGFFQKLFGGRRA